MITNASFADIARLTMDKLITPPSLSCGKSIPALTSPIAWTTTSNNDMEPVLESTGFNLYLVMDGNIACV